MAGGRYSCLSWWKKGHSCLRVLVQKRNAHMSPREGSMVNYGKTRREGTRCSSKSLLSHVAITWCSCPLGACPPQCGRDHSNYYMNTKNITQLAAVTTVHPGVVEIMVTII